VSSAGVAGAAYRPGDSFLHRMPAGTKLAALTLIGAMATIWRSAATSTILATCALGLYLTTRPGRRTAARTARRVLVVPVIVGMYQVWQRGWDHGVAVSGNLIGILLLATVLATVTSIDEMLDTITRLVRPLRHLGLQPELVAFAFSLMMRSLPATLETARETRQAAQARGLERDVRALLIPLAIRTVARARATGQAIHARNLMDPVDDGRTSRVRSGARP